MRSFRRLSQALAPRLSPPPPALWRQTDWRFLLPNPEGEGGDHVVWVGGSPEPARFIKENGIAKRVTTELPRERAGRARNLARADSDVRRDNAHIGYLGVLAREADRLFQSW